MKLSRQQLEAIVNVVYKRNQVKVNKEQSEFRSDKSIVAEAKQYWAMLEKFPKYIRERLYYRSFDSLLTGVIESHKLKTKTREYSHSEIREMVVIASIDAETLADLQKTFNVEF